MMRLLLAGLFLVAAALRAEVTESPFAPILAGPVGSTDRVAILDGGYDSLLVRVHLLRHARQSIVIQTFIWSKDEVGRLMMCELVDAARRGVKVRVIADHLGSPQDPDMMAFLASVGPNLDFRFYRPALNRLRPSAADQLLSSVGNMRNFNQRMHNKVMVVDGAVLITGGRNIENDYFDYSMGLNYRDRDVLVAGPAAVAAAEMFERYWSFGHVVRSRDLSDVAELIEARNFRRREIRADFGFDDYFAELEREVDDPAVIGPRFVAQLHPVHSARFVSDDPGKKRGWLTANAKITRELASTVKAAQQELVLQTPYLVLSPLARQLFADQKKNHPGLRIRISSNSFASTDNLLAYSANYRLRNQYVGQLDLEIHEFKPLPGSLDRLFPRYAAMKQVWEQRPKGGRDSRAPFMGLHAKSMVVDARVAFIGSYNLDPRSEALNTEAGLLVEDEAVARELLASIERDMEPANSWVIARRILPLRLEGVNGLFEGVFALSPIDIWPVENTSSFELKAGGSVVRPGDKGFYENYREVGPFPGTDGALSPKEIVTLLYKTVGPPLMPVL